jgi:hypothetical protein
MSIGLATPLRNARLQAIIDALDAGTGSGKFLCYTAPRPATGAAITTQTLLGMLTLSDPSGTVTGGVLTFSAIADDASADADGDIAFVRAVDSNDNFVMDMGAGVDGSGAEVIFNTVTTRTGGVIQMLSGALTEGND